MYPTYRFNYPRPKYSFDLRPYYDITEGDPDEVIVNNGTVTAALAPNGLHNGYLPSALRRITAPPFTLGDNIGPTFCAWGYDDDGFHMIKNEEYMLDFSLKGIKAHVDTIQFDGSINKSWAVDVEYNALPEKRVIIVTFTYQNKSSMGKGLKIAGYLKNPQITCSYDWYQYTPETGNVDANYCQRTGYGAIETVSTDKKASLIFGFDKDIHSYSVTVDDELELWKSTGSFSGSSGVADVHAHNQYLSHSFGIVAPGEKVSLSMIMSIADTVENARADFLDALYNKGLRLEEAEDYWNQKWEHTGFRINTPDEKINRMSEIAMMNGILGHDPVNGAWITSCGRAFRGVTFVWDQYYSGYGLLTSGTRPMVRKVLADTLSMDLTANNFYQITDRKRLGYHYAYQHYAITNLIYKYVALTGDLEFLNYKLDNGLTVIENLSAQACYIVYGIDFDFGAAWELLECLNKYIGDIPDLTANTCWMAEKIKAMALAAGREDIAQKMDPIRDKAYLKLQSLWDPDKKWFKTFQGEFTYTGQVFLSILSGVLRRDQIEGLMSRVDDFIGPNGVKALASYDTEFEENSRGDFNGAASYSGTCGEYADILNFVGDKKRLFNLIKGISNWWQWRPFQPQGIDSETGAAAGLIANEGTNNCASVYMSMVPMHLIGLRPSIGGIDINECYPDEWINSAGNACFNGVQYSAMVSLPCRGHIYTYYVDKPKAYGFTYSYASIYSADGSFLTDWHAKRLPNINSDAVFILHFDSCKPAMEVNDIVTRVIDASKGHFMLENRYTDICFTLSNADKAESTIRFKGAPEGRYNIYKNGRRLYKTVSAGPDGNFELEHIPENDKDHYLISLIPKGKQDLAYKKAVLAETCQGNGFKADNVVDGNDETFWLSEVTQLPHWIKLDLGGIYAVSRVDICWGDKYAEDYKVQLSADGCNWKAVALIIDNCSAGLRSHTFEPVNARYVRIVSTNRKFTSMAICSINVY